VGGSLRHVLTSGDLVSGEIGRTRGVNDGLASYSAPLTPKVSFSLRGGINDAAVVDPLLAPLDISSRDWNVEGGLSLRVIDDPLLPTATPGKWSPSRVLTTGLLVAHRETRDKLFGQPFSFSAGSVNGLSRYDVVRFVTDYLHRNVNEVISVSLTMSLGMGGTRSDIPGIATPQRHFAAILAQANYARRLNDNGLELHVRLTGQTTNSILYAAERLSVGGEASVRGYRENFTLADRGVITPTGGPTWKPAAMSVLVDGGTAGASEVLAAALRDQAGARLVGRSTFGDGTEQELMTLDEGSGYSLTIAKRLTVPRDSTFSRSSISRKRPAISMAPSCGAPGHL
jgi:hemolysin activation/secretion protein